MKFSEMPYQRPDPEAVKARTQELTGKLKNAKSYEEAKAVFLTYEEEEKAIDTMGSLAYVRHSIDTRDEFYDGEIEFWDEFGPELEEYAQEWLEAMLVSPFRKDFEAEYGDLLFRNAEINRKTFAPEIIEDMQKENELVTEYDKLIASAQIPFEGGVYTLSQLTPFKTDADDARRLAAWKAEGKWYKENQPRLDAIYDELSAILARPDFRPRALAEEFNLVFVDLQKGWDELFEHMHPCNIAWDRIHPNQTGHMHIARQFLAAVGALS